MLLAGDVAPADVSRAREDTWGETTWNRSLLDMDCLGPMSVLDYTFSTCDHLGNSKCLEVAKVKLGKFISIF